MQDPKIIQFASDNYVGAHPEVAKIIMESIQTTELPYGNDTYSKKANLEFKKIFQSDCETFFVGTGTSSNIIALKTILKSYECFICADIAHINGAECGAFENFTGAKIFPVKSSNGKMSLDSIKEVYYSFQDSHYNKPKAISLTQSTEHGTVYTCEEIKEICDFAHANQLYVHMDGARIANAAAYLNKSFKEMTVDAGVDILSFGATKNGTLLAESVVIFNKKLLEDFGYIQKQSMQLFSKMRMIPAQFIAYFQNDLWLSNALNANKMAKEIEMGFLDCRYLKIINRVETNQIFIQLPIALKNEIFKNYHFYTFSENLKDQSCTIRLVTSFNTSLNDVQKLISDFKSAEYNYSLLN
jgi:threonine aldolase